MPPAPSPPVAPSPAPAPLPRAERHWRDMPITPGTWRWAMEGGTSAAHFVGASGSAELTLRCDRARATITLLRPGSVAMAVPLAINTTSATRSLDARPQAGGAPHLAASAPASDPLWDAIVFSRGRFAVEVPGLAALYLPTDAEIGRVVEDCR